MSGNRRAAVRTEDIWSETVDEEQWIPWPEHDLAVEWLGAELSAFVALSAARWITPGTDAAQAKPSPEGEGRRHLPPARSDVRDAHHAARDLHALGTRPPGALLRHAAAHVGAAAASLGLAVLVLEAAAVEGLRRRARRRPAASA